jgi:hypothetical protein
MRDSSRPSSKILLDGGDPEETKHIRELLGFVDGQTTNPSLVAKNPEIASLVKSGQKLTEAEQAAENINGPQYPLTLGEQYAGHCEALGRGAEGGNAARIELDRLGQELGAGGVPRL